jgi:hypothetical protein
MPMTDNAYRTLPTDKMQARNGTGGVANRTNRESLVCRSVQVHAAAEHAKMKIAYAR